MSFAEALIEAGVQSLAVFGDSITVGLNATSPERRWVNRLAAAARVPVLLNAGISGTILQGGAMADGAPRSGNGLGRFRSALLGKERCQALAILYGYNDGRYVAAPQTLNAEAFRRDYGTLLEGLLAAGIGAGQIAIGSPPYPSDKALGTGGPGFVGQSRAGFEEYVDVVRDLAVTYGLHYAAVYEAMSAYPDGTLSASDITHPNDEGHGVIANAFVTAEVGRRSG